MYDIYYSLAAKNWVGQTVKSYSKTPISALMDAARLIRVIIKVMEIELLPIGEMEFVIWAKGKCQGYLQIMEFGPVTSAPDLEGV